MNNIYANKTSNISIGGYSADCSSEDAPDVANEFIIDFLDTDEKLFGFDRDEAIELTQNMCSWMYDNNYSCSKLSFYEREKNSSN